MGSGGLSLRERKKLEAWRAIRAAGLALFEEQGYEATTVEQIAAAANVSRATFFNYFPSKEAVVFEQDPEARDRWRALMDERPAGEPLWDALTGIILDFSATLRDGMPLQRRLKAQSPSLAQATQNVGDQFLADLRAWVAARRADDELEATLQLNLALAALGTAYQTWEADESFDAYLRRIERCLRQARPNL